MIKKIKLLLIPFLIGINIGCKAMDLTKLSNDNLIDSEFSEIDLQEFLTIEQPKKTSWKVFKHLLKNKPKTIGQEHEGYLILASCLSKESEIKISSQRELLAMLTSENKRKQLWDNLQEIKDDFTSKKGLAQGYSNEDKNTIKTLSGRTPFLKSKAKSKFQERNAILSEKITSSNGILEDIEKLEKILTPKNKE